MKKKLAIIFAVMLVVTALPINALAYTSNRGMPIQDGIMFDHLNYADVDLNLWFELLGPRARSSNTFHSPGFTSNVAIGGSNPREFSSTAHFDLVQQRFTASNPNNIPETRFQSICVRNSQVRAHFDLVGHAWNNDFFRPQPGHNMSIGSNGHGNFTVNINNRAGIRTEISGSFS